MDSRPDVGRSLVISYLGLRKAIGYVGVLLPLALVIGAGLLDGRWLERSLSAYYHTSAGGVFVGSLCAIGVFLVSYRGYDRVDDVLADVAAVFAVLTALFPTEPLGNTDPATRIVGKLHLAFAAGLFLALAYFALVQFRKSDPRAPRTHRKFLRNRVYLACGCIMLGCLAALFVVKLGGLDDGPAGAIRPVFWLETIAIVAFGISWLIKGEALLEDVTPIAPPPSA